MRIVGGQWGGRRLGAPRGSSTRPTSDRVREALFSRLADRIVGASIADLCAGTGALGLEALSRGAAQVLFVEQHRPTAAVIRENADALGASPGQYRIRSESVARFLERLGPASGPFDLVLCDPPYDDVRTIAARVFEAAPRLLRPDGWIVMEHRTGEEPALPPGLQALDRRKYGDTALMTCCLTPETTS